MKTHTRAARLRAYVVVIAAPLILAAVFGGIFWAKAVRTVGSVASPRGTWLATVRVINPGGSGGYSTHIVVTRGSAWWPSRKAKVFVADDGNGTVALGGSGELPVQLRWSDDENLLICYPAKAHVYRSESSAGPVHITYERR